MNMPKPKPQHIDGGEQIRHQVAIGASCATKPLPETPAGGFSFGGLSMAMTYGAGQAVGNLQAVGAQVVAPTIAGAIGKLDTINTRLAEAVNALEAISDQIGGPRAASTDSGPSSMPPTGAVNRMHNATDRANEKLAEIESLIGSISRMLG